MDNAKGKYIIWVDGDMILSRDFVKKLLEFMELIVVDGCSRDRTLPILKESLAKTDEE